MLCESLVLDFNSVTLTRFINFNLVRDPLLRFGNLCQKTQLIIKIFLCFNF